MNDAASSAAELKPIVDGVRAVLKAGLPVRPSTAPEVLVDLPNVSARATVANDALARMDALDRLMRDELKRLGLPELRKAAGVLFSVTGSGGNLTERRRHAADRADYELHHFRKRIEPKIVEQLAWQLYQGSLQFATRRNGLEPIAASGDTPVITPEHVEKPKTAEQEILLSEIWSEVYGLRAELIAREVAGTGLEKQEQEAEADAGALWRLARLLTKLHTYIEKFGRTILHGEADYDANALIRLAGWSGEVSVKEAQKLRFVLAKSGGWDRNAFKPSLFHSKHKPIQPLPSELNCNRCFPRAAATKD